MHTRTRTAGTVAFLKHCIIPFFSMTAHVLRSVPTKQNRFSLSKAPLASPVQSDTRM